MQNMSELMWDTLVKHSAMVDILFTKLFLVSQKVTILEPPSEDQR